MSVSTHCRHSRVPAISIGEAETARIAMPAIILLGAFLVPFLLIVALIRGEMCRRREGAALKRVMKDFE
jgi:hypothetical protein